MAKIALLFSVIIFLVGSTTVQAAPSIDEYMALRNQVLQTEDSIFLGGSATLDGRETLVNEILMGFKTKEYTLGMETNNGEWFAGTKHIFHAMEAIEASNVFKIIRIMPKGAALHMHDVTVAPTSSFMNISTWANLYYCEGDNNHLLFRFYPSPPPFGCREGTIWKSVASLRENAPSAGWVEEYFQRSMNMYTPTPDVEYPNTNVAWNLFEKKITTAAGMGDYLPAYLQYYYDTLKYHLDDNVMYIEMRGLLNSVYHLNQTELGAREILRGLKETTDQFLIDYPDFFGAKYIYAPHRFNTPVDIGAMIDDSVLMKTEFPQYFAGFDLVGQEDKGSPLLFFLPQLLNATDKGVKFFFHAGETDWRGTKIDENLIDAVLLNTTRIGHGYALYSHPYLYEKAKEQQIAVEVCPISNQILGLVKDFRNHPAFNYMRDDFPVVIAADGPGIYGMSALSHDYYVAFMVMGGEHADLRFLKKLAQNSIQYSAMEAGEKVVAQALWEAKWSTFLDEVIRQYGNSTEQDVMDNSIPMSAVVL